MTQYSIQLFQFLLNRRPVGLPDDIFESGQKSFDSLQTGNPGEKEVEQVILAYGKQAWAYTQAATNFFDQFGQEKQDELFFASLPSALQAKWKTFTEKGWSMHDFREGKRFEQFFTADENVAIEQSIMDSEDAVREYVEGHAQGAEKETFGALLKKYQEEQQRIQEKIDELRAMIPEEGEKWDPEMDNMVIFFERGLACVDERPTVQKVQEKIDWYRGQMEAGNK